MLAQSLMSAVNLPFVFLHFYLYKFETIITGPFLSHPSPRYTEKSGGVYVLNRRQGVISRWTVGHKIICLRGIYRQLLGLQ